MEIYRLVSETVWVDRFIDDPDYIPNFCFDGDPHQKYKVLSIKNKRR
jgi:hypothetical protein